jgi:hypothetical protein
VLTDLEVGQFHAFGFTVLRSCLTFEEMAVLEDTYNEVIANAPSYDYFGSAGTRTLLHFVEHDDNFAALVGHPRVMEAMRDIWGRECLYFASDMWLNMDDTPWHSDGQPGRQALSIKVTIYLDSMTAEQGALNVIPGSHQPDFCAAIMQHCGFWDQRRPRLRMDRDLVPGAIAIASDPGDIVIWDNRMWHSAWRRRDGKPRRALFLNYIPDPGDDLIAIDDLHQALELFLSRERSYIYNQRVLQKGGPAVQQMARRLDALTGLEVCGDQS